MKQTFTFYPSVIASTASTANAEIFDLSIEAFEQEIFKISPFITGFHQQRFEN